MTSFLDSADIDVLEVFMKGSGFVVSHAADASFDRGLRSFFEYRDLGIKEATDGQVIAHVIRAAGTDFSSQAHFHQTQFQFVYVLKGWIEFEYEGQALCVWRRVPRCISLPLFVIGRLGIVRM